MPTYECDKCGACCKGHLIVEAYEIDAIREPRLLTADVGTWTAGKTPEEILSRLDSEFTCLVIAANKPCKFLGHDNLCTIYPTRPNCCVGMEAGSEECQRAREAEGLPPLVALAES